ncbi:hypothetical protein GCM10017559_24890 [Streptosporangium longisporum]|uniref:Uncharacterized protein n=1 Tax=Streptosporangium longisporum TaxID=46187 RepID=A0ABP6KG49_9ACTN
MLDRERGKDPRGIPSSSAVCPGRSSPAHEHRGDPLAAGMTTGSQAVPAGIGMPDLQTGM